MAWKCKWIIYLFVWMFSLIHLSAQIQETQLLQDVTVISVEDSSLLDKSAGNVQVLTDKLLEQTPGITLIKRGNFAQEPTIRGFNQGQMTISIDGMRIFGACTDRMDPVSSYVEPNNLERFSVQFSPDQNSIGATLGGGIDFRLKKPQLNAERKFSGLLGGGYEWNAHAFQTLGALEYSGKKWAVRVNGLYRAAQNYWAARKQIVHFSQYEKWNAGATFVFQLNKKNQLWVDYIQDEAYNIGYPALTMDVKFAKAKIAAITHQYTNYDRKLYSISNKLYFNYINHAMDDSSRPDSLVPIRMDMPGFSYTAGFLSDLKWNLKEKHLLKANLAAYYNQIHAEMTMYPTIGSEMFMLTVPDVGRFSMQASFSDDWFISDKVSVQLGGLLEFSMTNITSNLGRQTVDILEQGKYGQSKWIWNAFAGASFRWHKNVKWAFQFSKGMRNATSQELFGFYLFNRMDNFDYIGNPNLKTEQSLNFNTNLSYKKGFFAIDVRAFAYWMQNYIAGKIDSNYAAMTVGANGVKQYMNIKNAYMLGGELALAFYPIKNLKIQSVNTYTRAWDHHRNALPYIAPFKSINSISYSIKGWHFTLESITAATQNHISSFYGEKHTKAFSILNFYTHKAFHVAKHYKIDVQVFVTNITDANYYEHLDVFAILRQGISFGSKITFVF